MVTTWSMTPRSFVAAKRTCTDPTAPPSAIHSSPLRVRPLASPAAQSGMFSGLDAKSQTSFQGLSIDRWTIFDGMTGMWTSHLVRVVCLRHFVLT